MRGKLWISLTGLFSLFGISITTHVFSWGGNKSLKPAQTENNYFKDALHSLKLADFRSDKFVRTKNSSLDKNHLGTLQYESEGSHTPWYFVTKDNQIIKISPSLHGQKKRVMRDGIFIDKQNVWFGVRNNNIERVSIDSIKDVKIYKNFFKKLDREELKTLQNWWNSKSDNDKCEILNIVIGCQEFKEILGDKEQKQEINKILELNIEQILTLSQQYKGNEIAPLKEIIGQDKVMNFPKLSNNVGSLIGDPIDKWLKEYLSGEAKRKEESGEINPFSLLARLTIGDNAYQKCQYDNNELIKYIYPECFAEIKHVKNKHIGNHKNENQIIPHVKEVIKGGIVKKWLWLPSIVKFSKKFDKKEKNSEKEAKPITWKDLGDAGNYTAKIIKDWEKTGRSGNLIDLKCQYLDWQLLKLFNISGGESQGCQLLLKVIFSGNIDDKRWCLFEINGAKKYIREYEFKFLSSFNWYDGNKFWAKCSSYNI
ncbi:hypothetical protein [Mycoplasma parvum]|uniref:Uncharacterized protein n=1 Tax=Mycoplasma parvum str. Indiana TaxID=1403316 RepID=U5NF81_9MOLU|nr:hypothetical protein [Mycoplasma parvum]AGX88853.1 hypothetical protein PRV_00390 [Mycoplasma parvum str. Indiana]